MLETTLTLFSSESIIDRLSAAETAIEVLFRGTWFVRLEVSRCKGSGIWIECPCCSFWWSFWKVFSRWYIFVWRCVCAREGARKKKRKLENLKIKRNSICRRLRIAKERKNRVLSSNSFNINVLVNVTSFSYENRSQSPPDIELIHHMTFAYALIDFSLANLSRFGHCENVIFSASFRKKHVLMSEEITFFLAVMRKESDQISHQRIKHDKLNWLIALIEWKSTT